MTEPNPYQSAYVVDGSEPATRPAEWGRDASYGFLVALVIVLFGGLGLAVSAHLGMRRADFFERELAFSSTQLLTFAYAGVCVAFSLMQALSKRLKVAGITLGLAGVSLGSMLVIYYTLVLPEWSSC